MTPEWLIMLMRISWLTLCGIMLFSRFAFQWAGPVRMRAFLNGWKISMTHRVGGRGAFLWGVYLLFSSLSVLSHLTAWNIVLGLLLIAALLADGLLNLLPSSFSRFKEKMQEAWVRRAPTTERRGDGALFGTVNLFLGLASVGMAGVVMVYRPLQTMVWVSGLDLALSSPPFWLVPASLNNAGQLEELVQTLHEILASSTGDYSERAGRVADGLLVACV